MEVAQITVEDRTFQKCTVNKTVESTEVETHLSIKLSKNNLGKILRPKFVRRTLVIGLIYGPRANKQFDIAFLVFWTLPGPIGHSNSLIFKPR